MGNTKHISDRIDDGILVAEMAGKLKGEYFDRVNGGEWRRMENIIPTEGKASILSIALGATAKHSGFYLALFSGSATPAENWSASSFASAASEIVSMTEGYTSPTRIAWTPPSSTAIASIDNFASAALFTFATASVVNVTGAALLTSNVRGGTTGILVSATKYPIARTFQNGDTYEVGYRISFA